MNKSWMDKNKLFIFQNYNSFYASFLKQLSMRWGVKCYMMNNLERKYSMSNSLNK